MSFFYVLPIIYHSLAHYVIWFSRISINLASRIGTTIGEDIAVRDDTRAVHRKRKKKIKMSRAHGKVQQKQHDVAKVVNKKEEYEAVRQRIRDQYLEKKVQSVCSATATPHCSIYVVIGGRRCKAESHRGEDRTGREGPQELASVVLDSG